MQDLENFTPRLIRYAVNTSGKDKDFNHELLTTDFRDTTGTIQDVADHVKAGYAICAGLLGGQRRLKANVIGSNWILVDIDNSKPLLDAQGKPVKGEKVYDPQLTIQQALEHPFVKQYCALTYTTASHTDDWHKFRLVFLLPEFIEDVSVLEGIIKFLLDLFPHDPSCKDASRVFFGSTKGEFPLVNPNAVLPQDWIEQAKVAAETKKRETEQRQKEWEQNKHRYREYSAEQGWNIDELILKALIDYIPSRCPGSGNYDQSIRVLMALNSHLGPVEAERIGEIWSPSIPGTTWNVGKKIRSFKSASGITIGTLFHIAKQYGFRFPVPKKNDDVDEPDSELYDEYLAQERERERIEGDIRDAESPRHLSKFFSRLRAKTNDFIKLFGGDRRSKKLRKIEHTFEYKPGCLPDFDKYKQWGSPKIAFAAKYRHQIWAEAIQKGYKFVLDTSHTGSGKSHAVGTFDYDSQVFYLSNDHRNPTTATIEDNYYDLQARHNGWKIDKTRKTPNGKSFKNRPKPGEKTDTTGNCIRNSLFSELRNKNIDLEGSDKYVCKTCPFSGFCASSIGDGYGLRKQRKDALEKQKVRAHPDSLPKPEDYDYSNVIKFWDEPGQLFKNSKSIAINVGDFEKTMGLLESKSPEVFNVLQPLRIALRALFNGETKSGRFGLDDKSLRDLLPNSEKFIEDIAKFGFTGGGRIS